MESFTRCLSLSPFPSPPLSYSLYFSLCLSLSLSLSLSPSFNFSPVIIVLTSLPHSFSFISPLGDRAFIPVWKCECAPAMHSLPPPTHTHVDTHTCRHTH